jgi:broad specificity phosphatase PhoE
VTRLILIRHGHTASNGGGSPMRMSGWTDCSLTERGRTQVRLLQQRLRGDPAFAAIYSSPLSRARETAAALVAAGLGSLHLHRGLREIHCGTLDGLSVDAVQRDFPDLWAANLRQDNEDFRWPAGESYRDFRRRCLAVWQTILLAHPGERVAIVTHAGVISQLVGAIQGTNPAQWERFRPGNTALTECVSSHGSAGLVRFDDRAHLAGEWT